MNIEDIVTVQRTQFKWFGLWDHQNQKWFVRFIYIVGHFFLHISVLLFMLLNIPRLRNLEETVQFMFVFLGYLTFVVKFINFYIRSNQIQSTLREFNKELDYCEIDEINEIVKPKVNFIKIFNRLYYSIGTIAMIAVCLAPAFSKERILVVPAHYPWVDWRTNNTSYGIILLVQIFAIGTAASLLVGMDTFVTTQLSMIANLFDVLGDKLTKLGRSSEKNVEDQVHAEKKLKSCIIMYLRILKCTNLMEDQFSLVYFIQFSINSIVICFTAYQISTVEPSSNYFAFLFAIFYIGPSIIICQIFIPCYFGNEIILKSAELSFHLYSSNWLATSKQFKKIMLIFMERLKRPAKINSYGIFTMGLETFTTVKFYFVRLIFTIFINFIFLNTF